MQSKDLSDYMQSKKGIPMRLIMILLMLLVPIQMRANDTKNWYQDFMFKDESFTFEFIRTLGYAVSGAADLGECIATARSIQDGDIYSWRDRWVETSQRMQTFARRMESQGEVVSAREAYFRASNYYRTAGFFLDAPQDHEQAKSEHPIRENYIARLFAPS